MRLKIAPIVILSWIGSAWSAPVISTATWTGTLDHSTVITATGTGFGTKGTAAPLVYDNFDSGSFNAYWSSTNDLSLVTTNQRNANSTRSAYLNFIEGTDSGFLTGANTSKEKWLCSFWAYFHTNFDWGTSQFSGTDKWLSNLKGPWRLWDAGAEIDNYFFQYDGTTDRLFGNTENVDPINSDTLISSFRTNFTRGTWHQFELMWDDSAVGSANGRVTVWVDGVQVLNDTAIETRDGSSVFKRLHTFGFGNSWSPSEDGGGGVDPEGDQDPNELWMDDAYADESWCSVFVSTVSTFAGGGAREYGLISAHSSTSITFTFKEGSFNAGSQTLYLYVRDDAGDVNANGLQLGASGGGGGGEEGGSSPGQFAADSDPRRAGYVPRFVTR